MTQAFNLSQFANKVNTSGQADLTTAVTGTLPVANGGTGANTLTSGSALVGNGTGAVSLVAAGASGNVLTSNGTTWTSAAAAGGGNIQSQLFTAPGTWTKPSATSQVRVTVVGGGGGTGYTPRGTTGNTGGTSSFGALVSATGGAGGGNAGSAPGSGTVTTGTAIKTAYTPNGLTAVTTYHLLWGTGNNPGGGYSSSAGAMAGQGAPGAPVIAGMGGLALAICPVSAPVSITIGAGGTTNDAPGGGVSGTGGAVLVEWIS